MRGFLGSVGYLADDITSVCIPMGLLHSMTAVDKPFVWTDTHQQALEQVKREGENFCNHHCVPSRYGSDELDINLVTDASQMGVAGVISQGNDWKKAKVAAFFSAKLNSAQQNYLVHKQEMLAGLETMKRYRDLLLGTHFYWYTDHKGLIYLMKQ